MFFSNIFFYNNFIICSFSDHRFKRNVNIEDINLQEIENALKPLSPDKPKADSKQEIEMNNYHKELLDAQKANYKKLLFKRDLDRHVENNENDINVFGKEDIEYRKEIKMKLLRKRDLSEKYEATKSQNESIEFDNSAEYRENQGKRNKRSIKQNRLVSKNNLETDLSFIKRTFDIILNQNKENWRRKREVNPEEMMKCEFFKNLLDEEQTSNEEERKLIREAKEEIKKENSTNSPEDQEFNVKHFDGEKEVENKLADKELKKFKNIRNKRKVHDHAQCLRRMKREPRLRKYEDRLPTKRKKRTTCPFFRRPRPMWNCSVCKQVFSDEGRKLLSYFDVDKIKIIATMNKSTWM